MKIPKKITAKAHEKLSGVTDLKNYDEVALRIKKKNGKILKTLLNAAKDGVDKDILKKEIIYGLDSKSPEYTSKKLKALVKIDALEGSMGDVIAESGSEGYQNSEEFARLFHYILGLHTETTELIEALLKSVSEGRVDRVNMSEEIGDCMWYISRINETLELDLETMMATNIQKLAVRYPDGFNEKAANDRDLMKELEVLKGKGEA